MTFDPQTFPAQHIARRVRLGLQIDHAEATRRLKAQAAVRENERREREAAAHREKMRTVEGRRQAAVEFLSGERPRTPRMVLQAVADKHAMSVTKLIGPQRDLAASLARQEAMWSIHTMTEVSFSQIGRLLNRDHTTVIWGVRRHMAALEGTVHLHPSTIARRAARAG